MGYASLMQEAITGEFNGRALPVIYNGANIMAVFRFIGVDAESTKSSGESTRADHATLLLLKSDVENPGYPDKAIVNGKTWTVVKLLKGGGNFTSKVLIERNRGRVA